LTVRPAMFKPPVFPGSGSSVYSDEYRQRRFASVALRRHRANRTRANDRSWPRCGNLATM